MITRVSQARLAAALFPLTLAACTAAPAPETPPAEARPAARGVSGYQAEIETWRAGRVERLTTETGWLSLAGLHRLDEGAHTLGSSPEADITLPGAAPAELGTLTLEGEVATLEVLPGLEVTVEGEPIVTAVLDSDATGSPTIVETGPVSFYVIERGEDRLLRVRDREHPAIAGFTGIDYFPVDESWHFDATFEVYDPVRQIAIANIIGTVSDSPSWGAVVFERHGETYSIDALAEPGDERLFLIFADETSGRETYGAGRYLYVDAPDENGRIDLDFNRAYNPPCAFTAFATCPLPPRQNRLALRIEAGEKSYHPARH